MATTSEIQVTEAYIGLLGRAPDPAGLAYWVAELDAAIASGTSAAVALKKLTNDITLSAEWDSGIGANDGTTEAGSEAIVTAMYDNLFDRVATQAELDYWAPKIVSGEFTASEMAVALIEGAGTTDADVLRYKQEAATYYVESVGDNHSTGAATASVVDVNGPLTLKTSKTATDYVTSGVGETTALTTAADTVTMTAGSDSVTGTNLTFGTTDNVTDTSSTDADTLTITGDDDFTFGTVVKVETIDVDISKQVGAGFTVDADKAVGGLIDFTVQPTVEIAGVTVTGETVLTVNNLASDLSTTNVTNLTVTTDDDAITVTTDSAATTVTVGTIDDGATSIVLGNDTAVDLDISGTGAANDSVSISGTGTVDLDVTDGVALVEELTLSGGSNDVNFDLSNVGAGMTYTTAGNYAVTLTGAAAAFTGMTYSMGADTGLDIDTSAAALDLTGQGVFAGGIDISVNSDATHTVTLQSGNTVSITLDQDAADELVLVEANDIAAGELTLNISNDTGELTTTNFETVTISTGAASHTIDEIDMDDNDAAVTIVGTGDLTFTGAVDTGSLVVTQNDVAGAAIDAGAGTLSLTANADDVTATGTVSAQNDITIIAEDSVAVAAVTTTGTGGITLTGDDVTATRTITAASGTIDINSTNDVAVAAATATIGSITSDGLGFAATGTLTASNDITITATDDVDVVAVTTTAGGVSSIEISGTEIDTTGVVGHATTTQNITLTASNDALVSTIGAAMNSSSSITLADGQFTIGTNVMTTESLLITGDTDVNSGYATVESVTITSTNDVTLGQVKELTNGEGVVVSGASATGAIDVTLTGDGGSGAITVRTGTGNDAVTLNEATGVASVETGEGTDTVTVTAIGAGTTIKGEGGVDTFVMNEADVAYTVEGGAGDDIFTVADESHATIDGGEGTGDTVNLAATFEEVNFAMSNIEKVDIAGAATLSLAQFANESSFELSGAGQVLTINGGGATALTIDASNVTANVGDLASLIILGSSADDTLTGSEMIDVITTGGGNDTVTGGGSADDFIFDAAYAGVTTFKDFVSGTDDIDLTFAANTHGGDLTVTGVASANGAVTLAANGITEITGTLQATITDFSNATQVLAAISGTSVSAHTDVDKQLVLVNSGGNAYLYLVADDGDAAATIQADEVTLLAIFEGADLANGDFI